MLNIGPLELLAIGVVALLVLGPEKLPGAVRTVGRVFGELRRISSGFQNELRDAFEQTELEQQMKAQRDSHQPATPPDPAIDRPDDAVGQDPADGEGPEPDGATEPSPDDVAETSGQGAGTEPSPDDAAEAPGQGAATEPSPDDAAETSGQGAGTEPTATEAAARAGADPGKDDEGASESHSEQDDSEIPRAGGPAPAGA